MNQSLGPVATRYIDIIASRIGADLGGSVPSGTTIVPGPKRAGSRSAVVYALPARTAIWCDPAVVELLGPLAGPDALSVDDIVAAAPGLGAELLGVNHNRVLEDGPVHVDAERDGLSTVWLDRDDDADVERLAVLRKAVSDDDAEEAEFDLDDLDPDILAFVDASGRIIAYAGARPWLDDSVFDDIAVLVHPDARRRGLGAAVVADFASARQAAGRSMLYRCDVENRGSNRLCESVGFTFVHSVVGIRFDDPAT